MDILGKLFGDSGRVRIMRLFLLNPGEAFTLESVVARSKTVTAAAGKEIGLLHKIGFIEKKSVKTESSDKKKKTLKGWQFNSLFPYARELRELLFSAEVLRKDEIIKKLSAAGRLKLVIISGIFLQDVESRADLLVVGDVINKKTLAGVIKKMEAEIGKEINYGVLGTDEYRYRLDVLDKFVRDILDFPHEKILDKLS